MKNSALSGWMALLLPLYLLAVLCISWLSRGRVRTSNEFLNASFSLPTWIVALSFLAYNCGSIEILAMSAMAAQYGVQALHFYWIGGIPGLIFMAFVVLPVYMRLGARSLPEFFEIRFGPSVRLLAASISAVSTAAFSGAVLYGLAQTLAIIAGWSLLTGTVVSASVVLVYVLVGGIRATTYTSAFQLCVMIAGIAPLLLTVPRFTAATFAARTDSWHLWKPLPALSPFATLDRFGVVVGLGFVISFAYWSTDFVMIQRALTAHSVDAARKVPLLAGFGKSAIAFLIVLPGVAASTRFGGTGGFSWNQTLPRLMTENYGPALLALGTAALAAGLMAGLAGNISGFSALWTEEIYRSHLRPGRSEQHYIWVGRLSVLAGIVLAHLGVCAALRFHNLMEYLQLILALFYAPVFAVVLAAIASKRTTSRGAVAGILSGVLAALLLQSGYWTGYLHFGSQMGANFYTAIASFLCALLACVTSAALAASAGTSVHPVATSGMSVRDAVRLSPSLLLLGVTLLCLCIILNWLWF